MALVNYFVIKKVNALHSQTHLKLVCSLDLGHTYGRILRLFTTRGRRRDFVWYMFLWSLTMLMFMLMFLVVLCVMWFLVLWHWLWHWFWLRWIRLEGGVWVGGDPWRPKVTHWIRVKTAVGRSFGLIPWVGLHNSVNRWALEHRTLKHGTFVLWALELWPLKLWAFHWRALEWWHHFHGVLVNWMSLHTAITRVPRTTTPLQLCDGFMCHFVDWFVHQTIPEGNNEQSVEVLCTLKLCESHFLKYQHDIIGAVVYLLESWTFLTPGTLVVLSFYIWGCPILHGK